MNIKIYGAPKLVRLAAATAIVIPALIIASASIALAQEDDEEIYDDAGISFDGLELIEASNVAAAYIDPEADFSVFQHNRIVLYRPCSVSDDAVMLSAESPAGFVLPHC